MAVELKKPDLSRYVYSRVDAIAAAIGVGGNQTITSAMRDLTFRVFAARQIDQLVALAAAARPRRNGRLLRLRKGEVAYPQQIQDAFDTAKRAQQDEPDSPQLSDEMLVIQLKPQVAHRLAESTFADSEHKDELATGCADLTREIHAHPLLIGRETDQATSTGGYL